MKDPTKLPPPAIEAHHRVIFCAMGAARYAINLDYAATATELTSNVVEIRPPAERPRLVLVPPPQKT